MSTMTRWTLSRKVCVCAFRSDAYASTVSQSVPVALYSQPRRPQSAVGPDTCATALLSPGRRQSVGCRLHVQPNQEDTAVSPARHGRPTSVRAFLGEVDAIPLHLRRTESRLSTIRCYLHRSTADSRRKSLSTGAQRRTVKRSTTDSLTNAEARPLLRVGRLRRAGFAISTTQLSARKFATRSVRLMPTPTQSRQS